MFDLRLAHLSKTMRLNQLDNSSETGFHVDRQSFHLVSNTGVEQLYNPHHLHDIAFLQYQQGPSPTPGIGWGRSHLHPQYRHFT